MTGRDKSKNHISTPTSRRLAFFVLLVLAIITVCFFLIKTNIEKRKDARAYQENLGNLASKIDLSFEAVKTSLFNLAVDTKIKDMLDGKLLPDDPTIMTMIQATRNNTGASLIYLMGEDGTVLACTPYGPDNKKTLTGNNYAFRPYFKEPMASSIPFIYNALGVTTGKRGFYISLPIIEINATETHPKGVIVGKIKLDKIDSILLDWPDPIALVGSDGIVFASNQAAWLFKSISTLNDAQRKIIIDSKKYSDKTLDALPIDLNDNEVIFSGTINNIFYAPLLIPEWRLIALKPRSKSIP